MRMLVIARELKRRGMAVIFLAQELAGNGITRIENGGFRVIRLRGNSAKESFDALTVIGSVDLLIVDSYALEKRYETALRKCVKVIAVFDDLNDRKHDADILVDSTHNKDKNAYKSLVGKHTKLLLGAAYTPLDTQYAAHRALAMPRRFPPRKIMIAMGGTDSNNLTEKALKTVANSRFNSAAIEIVLTSRAPHIKKIRNLIDKMEQKARLLIDIDNMAKLIIGADLAIGSGGVSSYERASLALATVTLNAAQNQNENISKLNAAGAVIATDNLAQTLETLTAETVANCEKNAFNITDGNGATRVCDELEKFLTNSYWS